MPVALRAAPASLPALGSGIRASLAAGRQGSFLVLQLSKQFNNSACATRATSAAAALQIALWELCLHAAIPISREGSSRNPQPSYAPWPKDGKLRDGCSPERPCWLGQCPCLVSHRGGGADPNHLACFCRWRGRPSSVPRRQPALGAHGALRDLRQPSALPGELQGAALGSVGLSKHLGPLGDSPSLRCPPRRGTLAVLATVPARPLRSLPAAPRAPPLAVLPSVVSRHGGVERGQCSAGSRTMGAAFGDIWGPLPQFKPSPLHPVHPRFRCWRGGETAQRFSHLPGLFAAWGSTAVPQHGQTL